MILNKHERFKSNILDSNIVYVQIQTKVYNQIKAIREIYLYIDLNIRKRCELWYTILILVEI